MAMDSDERRIEKKGRLLSTLDLGLSMIHLDSRRQGVVVPAHLRSESHLRLNLSYRFDPPDLSVGDWGVRATLSFGGKRSLVTVPWQAIFAITSQVSKEFWMYPEDLPPELMQKAMDAEAAAEPEPASVESEPRPQRPRLQLQEAPPDETQPEAEGVLVESDDEVASETEPAGSPEVESPPEAEKPRGRSHLRLVK